MRRILSPALATFAGLGLAAAAETYVVDPVHTHALFAISHLGFSNSWGRFNDVSGTYVWDAADPARSSVQVSIKTESLDTGRDGASQKRDEHLRSGDFLSVKEFPEMTFVSKRIAKRDDRTYDVTGDFTLHGVTREITVPVTLLKEDADPFSKTGQRRIGFETRFTIKRSDHGMTFMVPNVGDEVTITYSSEGVTK